MILAPNGILGSRVLEGFLRMAQGRNARHELYEGPGRFRHADGWGAVVEEAGRLVRVRGVGACWDDPALETLADRRVFLLHARRATSGAVKPENVHPFERTIDGDRWFFSHNGTIRDALPRSPAAEGETDSERYFDLLLGAVAAPNSLAAIGECLGALGDYTALDAFLLSRERAFVVCAWRGFERYYTLRVLESSEGPIFSSEPVREVGRAWRALGHGEVVEFSRSTKKLRRVRLLLS